MIRFDSIMAKWTRYAIFILLVFILTNCTKKTNLENKESIASNQVYRQKDITKIIDGTGLEPEQNLSSVTCFVIGCGTGGSYLVLADA